MGSYVPNVDLKSLREHALDEYPDVDWTHAQQGPDYVAVWGWQTSGDYLVALAFKCEDNPVELKSWPSVWNVRFISEGPGPFIQPPADFLAARP